MPKKNKKKVMKPAKLKRGQEGLPVSASSSVTSDNNVQYLEVPVKSDYDKNEYRVLLLPNGIKVALIATHKDEAILDPSVTGDSSFEERVHLASCCLCVNVGALSNPRKVPGVSSVLSGTFRNPFFKSELQKLTGNEELKKTRIELWELWEETIFRFCVNYQTFHDALKAFAQPFVSLVPTRDHVKMERMILENDVSDYYERFPENRDHSRTFTKLATTRHPIRTVDDDFFESLFEISEDKLYREVLKFCKRHYSANRMTLILKAQLPLDTLESYAIDCFSNIPNNGLPPQSFEPHNFANSFDNTKFRRIWAQSDDERQDSRHIMNVHWIMPPSRWLYKTKSLEYLAWIFSDLGTGSLRDYLIKKKWAEHVIAKVRKTTPWNTSLYSTLTIVIQLSDEGNNHIIETLDAVYSYINLVKREVPQQKIYDKIRINEEAKFRYLDYVEFDVHEYVDDVMGDDFDDAVNDLIDDEELRIRVEHMHLYEPADYITGPLLYYEYDPVSIRTCMELMTPERGCVSLNNREFHISFENSQPSEPATDGSIEIPENLIDRWKTIEPLLEFKLPGINRYWPDDFTIIDPPIIYAEHPVIVHSDDISEIWYKFDPTIQAPTCMINYCYMSPLPLESVENGVLFDVFGAVFNILMREELKSAKKAGLSGVIITCSSGLFMRFHGFTQTLPLLIETIAKCLPEAHHRLTEELFEQEKLALYRQYCSRFYDGISVASDIKLAVLEPGRWPSMDKRNTLRSITFDKLRHFAEQFPDHVYTKCLVQGNISDSSAVETARKGVIMSKYGAVNSNRKPERSINEIPRGKHCCRMKIKTSVKPRQRCYLTLYQFDSFSIKQAVFIDVLRAIFRYPRFAKLRKITTASRVIDFTIRNEFCVNSCTVVLNGDDNPEIDDDGEMELFDKRFLKKFTRAFTDNNWQCLKKILIHKTESEFDFELNWDEIMHSEYIFDRRLRKLDIIANLEAKDFLDWITHAAKNDLDVRKLNIVVQGCLSNCELNEVDMSVKQGRKSGNCYEIPPIQFEYLAESAKEKEKGTPNIYITDILKFKGDLESRLKKTGE